MKKISLLDCTLRDGGYVNDWRFGEETIKGFGQKIAQTGIEVFEVGFIKGDTFDPNRSVFPNIESMAQMIEPKSKEMMYVGMLDLSAPIPLDRLDPCDGSSIDGIRVIFKKEKMDDAYVYCKRIKELGYWLSVNFVGTDQYTDEEFVHGIEKFNELMPDAMSIVDSFGLIRRKQFLRLAYLADNNMAEGIALAYHAHNNLQQAMGNAEALVEMNLKRDLIIDACVFGMGRGAGNLNLELFAEYMNENYDTHYRIEPMLEIMDEYLNEIYNSKFWGYSLPLYLSASTGCHPNFAIYLAEKDSLSVKSFNELLKGIPDEDKPKFSKDLAEKYYREYQENYIDDSAVLETLKKELSDKKVLLMAPGKSLNTNADAVKTIIENENPVVISVNFNPSLVATDYIFSSNSRRYSKIRNREDFKCIATSNVAEDAQYKVNYSSYTSSNPEIIDNSGLMALRLLLALGIKSVMVAGMDGYSIYENGDYVDQTLEYSFENGAQRRNDLISKDLSDINKLMAIDFITPTNYTI